MAIQGLGRDYFGEKGGFNITDQVQKRKLLEEIGKQSKSSGIRSSENLDKILEAVRKHSGTFRATKNGLKKFFEDIDINPQRKLRELGIENMSPRDIKDMKRILDYEAPKQEEPKPEEEESIGSER